MRADTTPGRAALSRDSTQHCGKGKYRNQAGEPESRPEFPRSLASNRPGSAIIDHDFGPKSSWYLPARAGSFMKRSPIRFYLIQKRKRPRRGYRGLLVKILCRTGGKLVPAVRTMLTSVSAQPWRFRRCALSRTLRASARASKFRQRPDRCLGYRWRANAARVPTSPNCGRSCPSW